jgi:hypothetical protein
MTVDEQVKVALRAIKYGVSALVAQVDQVEALLSESAKSAPSEAPARKQRKPRAVKGAAQSFAEEVIAEINDDAEEIEAHGEINGTDLSKQPKKRGRPKGSKNAGPRKHGEMARKIQGYIEEVGVGEVITTQQVVTLTGALGPNVSRELSRLVDANVLARSGRGEFTVRSIPAA